MTEVKKRPITALAEIDLHDQFNIFPASRSTVLQNRFMIFFKIDRRKLKVKKKCSGGH